MPSENSPQPKPPKRPVSALVVLHDGAGNALLLERADKAGYWQSVTGSLEAGETPAQAALRETAEETGIALPPAALRDWHYSTVYEIYPHWRHRYAAGVTRNTEHLSPPSSPQRPVRLSEHTAHIWLPLRRRRKKSFPPPTATPC